MIRPSGKAVPRTSLESYYCVLYLETFGNSLLHEAFQPRGTNQSSLLNSTVRYYLKLLRICMFMRTIEPHREFFASCTDLLWSPNVTESLSKIMQSLENSISIISIVSSGSQGPRMTQGCTAFGRMAPSPPITKTLGHPWVERECWWHSSQPQLYQTI